MPSKKELKKTIATLQKRTQQDAEVIGLALETNRELTILRDRLKLEAEIHAGEARAQRSTVHDIYQTITGATGEPGDWNGAEPVRKLMAEVEELRKSERIYRLAFQQVLSIVRNTYGVVDRQGPPLLHRQWQDTPLMKLGRFHTAIKFHEDPETNG